MNSLGIFSSSIDVVYEERKYSLRDALIIFSLFSFKLYIYVFLYKPRKFNLAMTLFPLYLFSKLDFNLDHKHTNNLVKFKETYRHWGVILVTFWENHTIHELFQSTVKWQGKLFCMNEQVNRNLKFWTYSIWSFYLEAAYTIWF
jgi:hypothetical protein